MIHVIVEKVVDDMDRVRIAAEKAARRVFAKAAYRIGGRAIRSIKWSSKPSAPGTPPHTKRGKLRRSIRYFADHTGAVIGPRHSAVGESARAHEFGGEYMRTSYEARPFMRPALEADLKEFAGDFSGSITE